MTYAEADTAYRAAYWTFTPIEKAFLAGSVSYEDYFAAKAVFTAASDALDAAMVDDDAAEVDDEPTETQIELF